MARCEVCVNLGPTKIKYDLDSAKEHAKTHFLQLNIVNDQVSADQIFEDCFPAHQLTAAPSGTQRSKSLSRQILLDLCHSLFPRKRMPESPASISCAKCGVECKYQRRTEMRLHATTIIDHACIHLDEKELFACRHCSRKYKTCSAVRKHLRKAHRINSADGHFEDKSHNFVKEISDQINNCFGQNTKRGDFDRNWARLSLNIRRSHKGSALAVERQLLCHQLIRKTVDRGQRVKCRLCSTQLSIKHRTDGISIRAAMEHLLLHLEKPTMRCRICAEVFMSRSKLQKHFRNVHSLPMANNYDCLADEFHTEILNLLHQCYGTNGDGNVMGDTIAPKSEQGIRQNAKGSVLAIERKLLCHQLIRKFANSEKQVQCRLCSKLINGKQAKSAGYVTEFILRHALQHLAKPLFRCKQCSTTYWSPHSMAAHLRINHALPLENNHVCSQDEHHSEILAMLRECYGDERDGVKMG